MRCAMHVDEIQSRVMAEGSARQYNQYDAYSIPLPTGKDKKRFKEEMKWYCHCVLLRLPVQHSVCKCIYHCALLRILIALC